MKYDGEMLQESSWCGIPFDKDEENFSVYSIYMIIATTSIYYLGALVIVTCLYIRFVFSGNETREDLRNELKE